MNAHSRDLAMVNIHESGEHLMKNSADFFGVNYSTGSREVKKT